ncbi:glycoside hydrolase family 27 protein [Cellulomonas sp. Sa3CUA2]|uniref:Alpha-galactosidase n=1 Tax=Cellulomonas avistercoris TaxID=2762242 RepID=A0ABR8QI12_9CELL|nr:glycoside hydrolase family 27 protein [Cellulomonas avistercoris]MBD7920063.1 glycoside hydrolase family 27 protein [Cellulomonas avistercoris]
MAVALTPPMGWNSWDCYGTTVTEAEVLANARFMAEHLLPYGWDTVVVDIDWSDPDAHAHGYNQDADLVLDAHGYPQPAPGRFPSAAGGRGFAELAAQVHALGLRFGVHALRGIPRRAVAAGLAVEGAGDDGVTTADIADTSSTCPWNGHMYGLDHGHPAAQTWLDGLVAQLASWGVDLVKVDDMLAPFHADAVAAWSRAIERSGREIVLSLSPGTALSTAHLPVLRTYAQMWRVCDDLWDRWEDVHANFARLARWAPFQQPGGWADADMLPLGRIGIRAERGEDRSSRLTPDEQRTLLTLWVMARSPLMMGGDLPTSDAATVALLTTPAVGHVLRTSTDGRELLREPAGDGEVVVWSARSAADPTRYVAVFWTGSGSRTQSLALSALVGDAAAARSWSVTDLWTGDRLPDAAPAPGRTDAQLVVDVPSHGVRWLALDPV